MKLADVVLYYNIYVSIYRNTHKILQYYSLSPSDSSHIR